VFSTAALQRHYRGTAGLARRTAAQQHCSTATLILITFSWAMAKHYDTNTIESGTTKLQLDHWGKFSRIGAFLADLHVKEVGARENKTLEILQKEKPDVILLGGDLIGFESQYAPLMFFLSRLEAPHAIYAVLGNTEYADENEFLFFCHEKGQETLKQSTHAVFL
jgi:predicted MPP superfamily phosphohydrolase